MIFNKSDCRILPLLSACFSWLAAGLASAGLTVGSGASVTLAPGSSIAAGSDDVVIRSSGVAEVSEGAVMAAGQLTVEAGGFLSNCGEIVAEISNEGEIVSPCGSGVSATYSGDVQNIGVFRVSHRTQWVHSGSFSNSGVLDLITSLPSEPPAGFTNSGILHLARNVRIERILVDAGGVEIRIHGIAPHTYQLQEIERLDDLAWGDVGAIQIGTGGILVFQPPGGPPAFERYFYRIEVGDQN